MSGAEPLFLDTGGLVALLVADDAPHDQATRRCQSLRHGGRPVITSDWVLAEIGRQPGSHDRHFEQAGFRRLLETCPATAPQCRI